ncbi:hypothetical protein EG68_11706 [Paragonimus skrjabini miyazakii]|uniref:NTF2 domain-containing protein n=1 Tax=Paragonimus skrjabini miyazakii TaxID=59628 RepID=A0A8S9YDU7_9TREM|nr:hypothetical protein EG68_11706 [Paragonimus skrjabini miyazakii]
MGAGENNSAVGSAYTVSRMDPADIQNLAGEFVVQYYTVMKKCPSVLHRFYKDDSAMIHEDSTVFGQKLIHDKIMSMNVRDSRVGIVRLDALRANGNSVLIQVSGEISINGGEFRRFMQSFVLFEQAPCDFYVLNDIFRYQDHVYGDVKKDGQAATDTAAQEASVNFHSDGMTGFPSNSDTQEGTASWENALPTEVSFTSASHEPQNTSHTEEIHLNEPEAVAVDHSSVHESHAPTSPQPVPSTSSEEHIQVPTAPPQPCSWAQMASKQPAHGVLHMQSVKSKTTISSTNHALEEQSKVSRQTVISNQNPANNRFRGAGGRNQQPIDGRVAAGGDHTSSQDARAVGQGPMRMSSGRGGGGGPSPMNVRGGTGRGGRAGMMVGGSGRGSGPFPRRGQ